LIIITVLFLSQFTYVTPENSRSTSDLTRPSIEDNGEGGSYSTPQGKRASFDYQQNTAIPFRWEEPLAGAARIPFSSGGYATVSLGFNFDFYDETYSSINLFTHGYASFTSTYSTTSNPSFPTSGSDYQKIISPLWDYVYYWNAAAGSGIYHKRLSDPDRYVITWYQAPYDWGGGACTFQVVLYKDLGHILFNFKTVAGIWGPTVGLNDGDGTHYNMPYHNQNHPRSSQSIVFGTVLNDVAVDRIISPEAGTRVRPDTNIYINSSIINYGFNNRNGIPVDLTITCDQDPTYLYEGSTFTSGNQGVMESKSVSFAWRVPVHENRDYTITVGTALTNPPDEVADGNSRQFRIKAKTYFDVGIWEIERIRGEWYPYMEIPVTVKLANWGNIDTNFSLRMNVNGRYSRIRTIPVVRSGNIEGVLERHIENVTFTWMVQSTGQYTLTFTTILENDENPGNDRGTVEKDVVVSPFRVRLSFNNTALSGEPNSPVAFQVTVHNDGEKKDDIQLNVTDYPQKDGWAKPNFDHPVLRNMGRDTYREVSVIVPLPPTAMAGIARIRIRALSLGDGNTNYTLELPLEVLPDPKVEVVAPDPKKAGPGEKVRYNFTVRNRGNSIDSFSINAHSSNNWDIRVVGSSITPNLTPFSHEDNYTYHVEVTVPETAMYGSTDILKVTAASVEDINVQSSDDTQTTVLQRFDVRIKSRFNEYSVHTEEFYQVSFNVTNAGNGKDGTIGFVTDHPEGWETYIDDGSLRDPPEPLWWRRILMKVRVPRGTARDVYPVNVTVMSGVPPEPRDTYTFLFEILPEYGINISSPAPTRHSRGSDVVKFPLVIKNTGNTYEPFNVSSPSTWMTIRRSGEPLYDLWLGANESVEVEAWVNIPGGTNADADNTTKNKLDGYRFKIEVYSSLIPDEIRDETHVHMYIDPLYDHEVYSPWSALKVARKCEVQTITDQLILRNTGNVGDTIALAMAKGNDGPVSAAIWPKNVILSHATAEELIITLTVCADAELGTYELIIESRSAGNVSSSKNCTVKVDVVDYDFKVAAILLLDLPVDQGDVTELELYNNILVEARVENSGSEMFSGIQGKNVTVSFYFGSTLIHKTSVGDIDMDGIRSVSFVWTPRVLGSRDLVVRLNEEETIPESDTRNNDARTSVRIIRPRSGGGGGGEEVKTSALLFYGGIVLMVILAVIIIISAILLFRKGKKYEGYDEEGVYRPDLDRKFYAKDKIKINIDEWESLYEDEVTETQIPSHRQETYRIGKGAPVIPAAAETGHSPDPGRVLSTDTAVEPNIVEIGGAADTPPLSIGQGHDPGSEKKDISMLPAAEPIPAVAGKSGAPAARAVTRPVTGSEGQTIRKITTKPVRQVGEPASSPTPNLIRIKTQPLPVNAIEGPRDDIKRTLLKPLPILSKKVETDERVGTEGKVDKVVDNADEEADTEGEAGEGTDGPETESIVSTLPIKEDEAAHIPGMDVLKESHEDGAVSGGDVNEASDEDAAEIGGGGGQKDHDAVAVHEPDNEEESDDGEEKGDDDNEDDDEEGEDADDGLDDLLSELEGLEL